MTLNDDLKKRWGSRKLLIILIATLFVLVGKATMQEWLVAAGIYAAGNLGEHFVEKEKIH